jgi:hypothetical protein
MGEMIYADDEQKPTGMPRWLVILLGMSAVLLLWAGSFYFVVAALRRASLAQGPPLPAPGELMTLLFGASAISLGLFTIFAGGVAIFGWQSLKQDIAKDVRVSLHKQIDALERELRGRVLAAIGMVLGLFYVRAEKSPHDEETSERADFLAEAVQHCWAAYKLLKDLEGNGKYMALNNFLYFSAVQGATASRDFLLDKAKELKRVGEEKSHWEGLLTYCRVILEFSDSIEELKGAHLLASQLDKKSELTNRQKREAASYAASLSARLTRLSDRAQGT